MNSTSCLSLKRKRHGKRYNIKFRLCDSIKFALNDGHGLWICNSDGGRRMMNDLARGGKNNCYVRD